MKLEDIKSDDGFNRLSIAKLTGLKIKDITGHISKEFGEPVFIISTVVLENDVELGVEGEHDMPYLYNYQAPNMDINTLNDLYQQKPNSDGYVDEDSEYPEDEILDLIEI